MADTEDICREQRNNSDSGQAKSPPRNLRCVENCDNEHRRNVVNDSQGGKEYLQAHRDTWPKQGHDPDHKGNVRRHRDTPSPGARAARVQG